MGWLAQLSVWSGQVRLMLALAVELTILLGPRLRCLHPPAGGMAFLVVFLGVRWHIPLFPVLGDSLLLVRMAWGFSRLVREAMRDPLHWQQGLGRVRGGVASIVGRESPLGPYRGWRTSQPSMGNDAAVIQLPPTRRLMARQRRWGRTKAVGEQRPEGRNRGEGRAWPRCPYPDHSL